MEIITEDKPMEENAPKNDFGRVRDRRDFDPLDLGLKPILPSPHRDFSFTGLTGWRYQPTFPSMDRLGSMEMKEVPLGGMKIPESWGNENGSIGIGNEKRVDFMEVEKLDNDNASLGNSTATTVANTTFASSSTNSSNSVQPSGTNRQFDNKLPENAAIPTPMSLEERKMESTTAPPAAVPNPSIIPKSALYVFYGKKPRRIQLSGTDYITWDNGSRTHELKYTSIFVCPITKEYFLAGHYGNTYFPDGNFIWYTKKSLAEHAAAARALDCWNFREGTKDAERMGHDEPYMNRGQPSMALSHLPKSIRQSLEKVIGTTGSLPNPGPSNMLPPTQTNLTPADSESPPSDSKGPDQSLPTQKRSFPEELQTTIRARKRPERQPQRDGQPWHPNQFGPGDEIDGNTAREWTRNQPPPQPHQRQSETHRERNDYVTQRGADWVGDGYYENFRRGDPYHTSFSVSDRGHHFDPTRRSNDGHRRPLRGAGNGFNARNNDHHGRVSYGGNREYNGRRGDPGRGERWDYG